MDAEQVEPSGTNSNPPKRIERRNGSLVIVADEPLPEMPVDLVRRVLEAIRK